MIERILFPTDGSPLSERALETAVMLASAHGAEIIAARVVEPNRWMAMDADESTPGGFDSSSADMYMQVEQADTDEARADLDDLAMRIGQRDIRVRTFLLKGMATHELLFLEEQEAPDLVVMGSHGRTGLARVALGSVADRLVREGRSPVLIVRSLSPDPTRMERALVPLDGSAVAEAALPVVEILAGKPLRSAVLLRVVESAREQQSAFSYLADVSARLTNVGLDVRSEVREGSPIQAIAAEVRGVDMVIMATHGRSGFDRLRHGSVASEAVKNLTAPILLVRAQPGAQSEASSAAAGSLPV
jgi:nucleotide-binding universal stress UspA family protein